MEEHHIKILGRELRTSDDSVRYILSTRGQLLVLDANEKYDTRVIGTNDNGYVLVEGGTYIFKVSSGSNIRRHYGEYDYIVVPDYCPGYHKNITSYIDDGKGLLVREDGINEYISSPNLVTSRSHIPAVTDRGRYLLERYFTENV